ncbi:carboxymuconolactone decarboxylase family protein [Novosphingobium sp. M1R2S20]|uniref:Carboxymuconolactone decarboxylase family protein n=1 Tax=Novosphingobium rhizovicinum TaxID=3228928 RepID=A0ABV3RET0_9SPHN
MDRSDAAHPETPIRVPPLPRDQWTDAAREVFAFWGEPGAWENGSRTSSQMVLANHPPLAMAFNHFGKHVLIDNTAPAWARELVTLRVAWHMKSQYEWHYHVGYALNLGMTLEQVAAIVVGPDAGSWSELDAAVLRCVDELWTHSRVQDATWAVLAHHFDTQQLMDLIFALGQYVMLGWALAAFGVQLEEGVDPIGFDLKTRAGLAPGRRLKPGEGEGWAEKPL